MKKFDSKFSIIELIYIVLAASIVFVGCSKINKPSEDDLLIAVGRCLQNNIPVSWVGNFMGGKNANINRLDVVQIGIYNKESKYWPMKLRCQGTCQLNDPFNKGRIISFDRVGEFLLYQDDYGEWQAKLRGGLFQ